MNARSFSELRKDLYERSPESEERVTADVEALAEELGLSDLRQRVERTQSQIAGALGTTQSGVSRIERQEDILVSTLREYVRATGGELHLIAQYPEWHYEISIGRRRLREDHAERRSFTVVWQEPHTRQFVSVGYLEVNSPTSYVFEYSQDAQLHTDFQAFDEFPDMQARYESSELAPFFADRLPSTARPGYDDILAALGLTREEATPVELLARSWDVRRTSTIQLLPEPVRTEEGVETLTFLASGCRHVDEDNPDRVADQIAKLAPGHELRLRDEPDNERNMRALLIDAAHQEPVGWVPDYLLDYVHKKRGEADINVVVERANGADVPWHLRLLCRMEIRHASGPEK